MTELVQRILAEYRKTLHVARAKVRPAKRLKRRLTA
jgi:hypothetical protein